MALASSWSLLGARSSRLNGPLRVTWRFQWFARRDGVLVCRITAPWFRGPRPITSFKELISYD